MPDADADDLAPGLARAKRPVERVLDVGGGTGRAARALRRTPIERAPVVLDASAGMLAEARDHGLPVVRADAATLPVADASVDAVVIVDALHHFPDARAAVAEATRVLRPGGVLVVREFDPGTLRGRLLVAAEHVVGFEPTFLGADELATLLARSGLDSRVLESGFAYTVVGVKPRSNPSSADESRSEQSV
ncbi:class I SAM-dependent methyltransferase [Halobacterium zhouii]|uniref:class I SAM-dependent methyltransferase n=1 Tax=Halobacterium zhouii TaxID=2902624 RepID=UPI0032C47075